MTKDKIKLSKKVVVLFFIASFFIYNSSYSQCGNPTPTGDSDQDFCLSDSPTINDLVANGGTIVWYDLPTGGSQLAATEVLVDGITYYADDIASNPDDDCSVTRLAVTANVYGDYPDNVSVGITFCKSNNATVGNLPADGSDIEWYDAEFGGNLLASNELLVDGTTYYVQQTENGCVSLRKSTVVTIIDPEPPVVEPNQSFCSVSGVTISDLQGVGINIIWYNEAVGGTPLDPSTLLSDGEDYWGAQSSNTFPCESTVRAQTTVEIEITPIAGADGSYTTCEIDAVTTDLFSLLGGTPDTTGTWTGPSTLTGDHLGTYDPAVNVAGTYTYTVNSISGICPDDSADVVVTITQIPPPSVSATTQEFCELEGATVAELVATGSSLLWYGTESSTTPLAITDVLVDGEDYWASQTDAISGCESASRTVVNVTIFAPLPPTTSNVNQQFCEIDNPTVANLDATGDSVFWYADATSTIRLNPTDALVDGEDYYATQIDATTGCESATRLMVTVTIIVIPPPTTAEVNQSFCEIDNATVADLVATGSGVLWYDTDTDTTPLDPTTAIVDGEDYFATQTDATSGCESLTRLTVTATIIVIPPPTTTEVNQTFCEIDNPTIANLVATGTNLTWYATETDTTPLSSTDALVDGEDYWSSQTDVISGCESATRLAVTVTVMMPPPPTTTEVNQQFCEIDNATVGDLTVTGDGILWYATETDTTPLNTTELLVDGEDYWASQTEATSGCESATRLVVNATILVTPPPTTSSTAQSFCEIDSPTVANLEATGNNVSWYDNETDTTPLNATDLLVEGEDYWASQTDATTGCESASRIVVTVTLTSPLPPTTTEVNQTFCEVDNATVADLDATGTNILWYASETDTTPINNTDALIDGEDYWASQSDAVSGCESATRLVVNVTITTVPPPSTTETNQAFCLNDYLPGAPTVADLTATGNGVLWFANESDTTPLATSEVLINGEDYWASQTDATSGCESATRLVVTVSVIDLQAPTTSSPNQTFCVSLNPTIADLQATGSNILWYANETDTTPLNSTDPLVDGEDYWATQSDSNITCESLDRLVVNVTISDVPPAVINSPSQTFCAIDGPTVADIDVTGNAVIWYDSETSTTPIDAANLLTNGEDYWAADTDPTSGCESSIRVVATVTLIDPGTPTLTSLGNEFCKIENPTLADLNSNVSPSNGGSVSWYDAYPNGNLLSLSEALIEGGTYYAAETDDSGCSSATALTVTVTLEACDDYAIEIYDGFSPSGNGINDTFKIKNLKELYPNFRVEFYNRWGAKVYTQNASKPDWDGTLNGNGELLPAGVYFVIVHFNEDGMKPIQDRLYLSR
ncbi:MAG: hypothetical protein BM563_04320 [Bacteroidetes bacterium MedPE-SWsnd-G1]|nr:MAG: hypothetical protein BM563_04320 [Bacteroidetes bacterium MedPE-SWsnd-G1]